MAIHITRQDCTFIIATLLVTALLPISSVATAGNPPDTAATCTVQKAKAENTDAPIRTFGTGGDSVAFSPDGTKVLTLEDDPGVAVRHYAKMWDLGTGELIRTFGIDPHLAVFSPDGSKVLTVEDGDHLFVPKLWNLTTNELVRTFSPLSLFPFCMAISPDGTKMLFGGTFGGDEAGAELWDMATGTLVHTLSVGEDTTRSVAFSPDGTKVLVASRTGALLFDSATGAAIRKFMHDGSGDRYVRSVAFSPDGSKLLTGGGDYAHGPCAKLWDATTTGLLIQTFSTDGESVTGVAFSPDSSKVLTAAGVANKNDALFGLWDAANGKLLRSFKIAAVEGYSVAFSPDGTRVLLGANSTTYLFDATAVGNDAGCFGKKSVLGFGDLEALLEDLFLSVLSLLCLFVAAPRLGPRR